MALANIPGHLARPKRDMDVVPGSFRGMLAKNKQKIVLGTLLGADYKFHAGNYPQYTCGPINRVDYSWRPFYLFFCKMIVKLLSLFFATHRSLFTDLLKVRRGKRSPVTHQVFEPEF